MSLIELFQLGGPVVIALLLLSVTLLIVAFERIFIYISVSGSLKDLQDREVEELQSAAEYDASIVEHWLNRLLQVCQNPKGTRAQFTARFEDLEDALSVRLTMLALMARIAPLTGLLGTVMGIIRTFRTVEKAGTQVNPQALAGGIWEALGATGIGLIVAILGWLFHSYLENWLSVIVRRAEHLVVDNPTLFGRFLDKESAELAKDQTHAG